MKIRDGYGIFEAAGEIALMPTAKRKKPGTYVMLNEASALLVERMLEQSASREELVALMLAEYEADAATVTRDVEALLAALRSYDLLEEDESV